MSNAEKWALIEAESLLPEYRELFDAIVSNGNTPQFAMMCIHQESSKIGGGDAAFCRSRRRLMNDMTPEHQQAILRIAQRAGINTEGKFYHGQLGRYNDPHAWVSTADDFKRECREQNLGCDGVVKHKAVDTGPHQGPELAEDIVRREMQKRLTNDESLREQVKRDRKKLGELREAVIAKHGKKRLVYGG